MSLPLLPTPKQSVLEWHELTRSAVAKHVTAEFAEACYVMLVAALAECAEQTEAVPKQSAVAFSRAPGKWQKLDVPTMPPLQVHAKATFDGEWYDYSALLPDQYDPIFSRTLQ